MKTPHKHAEIIKAWADGAEIEYQCAGGWEQIPEHPYWPEGSVYRIKPEPKPDVELCIFASPFARRNQWEEYDNNIKLTFDGETGALKAAEVLK
jgi:hypothetical protein